MRARSHWSYCKPTPRGERAGEGAVLGALAGLILGGVMGGAAYASDKRTKIPIWLGVGVFLVGLGGGALQAALPPEC